MSAAENHPPNTSSQSSDKPLSSPPKRPSLRKPPARPESGSPPAAKAPSQAVEIDEPQAPQAALPAPAPEPTETAASVPKTANHPITPPSEPMQYRAIGLVRGIYQPSEEQLNRGNIVTDDGTTIDSVLLGRVTSLIKKHIDLESSHLWVVYPRTRQPLEESDEEPSSNLHLQIVGIWEPDTLGLPGENPKTIAKAAGASETAAETAEQTETAEEAEAAMAEQTETAEEAETVEETSPVDEPSENYFSVRGEVLNYDEDTETILVKIVQGSKQSNKPPKAFKLHLFGQISGKTVGYFWEFDAERQDEKLIVTEGRAIRMVPPKKKKKGRSLPPRRGKRMGNGGDRPKPARNGDKPRVRPPAPVKSNPL